MAEYNRRAINFGLMYGSSKTLLLTYYAGLFDFKRRYGLVDIPYWLRPRISDTKITDPRRLLKG